MIWLSLCISSVEYFNTTQIVPLNSKKKPFVTIIDSNSVINFIVSLKASKHMIKKQIKSKKRIADFGEVFTAHKQVSDMIDMVDITISQIETTVFEPACGSGNFLIELLSRKQKTIMIISDKQYQTEYNTLKAVASLYGVDIQKDNVLECRERLFHKAIGNCKHWSASFLTMLREILNANIICGDTLSMIAEDGTPLTIPEWEIQEDGIIIRKDVLFSDMITNNGECSQYIKEHYYQWSPEEETLSA